MKLLLSQKNELYDVVESGGFSPYQFQLTESVDQAKLSYKGTDYHFSIGGVNGSNTPVIVCPGERQYAEVRYYNYWFDIKDYLKKWLQWLRRETNEIDKWSRLEQFADQVKLAKISEGDKFSTSEYEDLKLRMKTLKQRLDESNLTSEQLQILGDKLDHITSLAIDMNKFDWTSLFVGTIISIIIQLSVNPENAKSLWNLVRSVFNSYFIQ